jgi:hypothetical protein
MIQFLAQTTQQTGMKTWGPLEWGAFFTAAGIFVGGLVTGIVAIINASRANTKAASADANARDAHTAATDAKVVASEAKAVSDNNSAAIGRTNDRIVSAMKPTAPPPEEIAKAFDASKEINTP